MSTLFPKTITLQRVTGSYVNGIWTANTVTTSFEGSVQPITGKELETLDIGRRDMGKVKVYSSTKLRVSVEGTADSGDKVIYDGRVWELIAELAYQNDLIPHYKYIAEYRSVA